MKVTTSIPCGNGRVLRADADAIEVEMIAYSRAARYVCLRISEVEEAHDHLLVLRPDRHFGLKTFGSKFHSQIWVRHGFTGGWEPLPENAIERLPEAVRIRIPLQPGIVSDVCTEVPRPYGETTAELAALVRKHPGLASLHSPGASEEGRPLFLLRVTEPENRAEPGEEGRPVIHIVCGEHATEFAGEEMGRGMLELVMGQNEAARALREAFIFDIILTANPDGNYHGWHQYNARDWAAHSYNDGLDRSWHHEFVPFLLGEPGTYSAETCVWMNWLRRTRPALYLSFHSWEGHYGRAGAFHAAPESLSPGMQTMVGVLNHHAAAAAAELGEPFLINASRQKVRHLGGLLMQRDICPAYLPEAHGNWGAERLQYFGRRFLSRLLQDKVLALASYNPARWERLKTVRCGPDPA